MTEAVPRSTFVSPAVWTLIFNRTATTWWARLLAFGEFKHVRAFAYDPGTKAWVFYDVHLTGTELYVVLNRPDAHRIIQDWMGPRGSSELIAMQCRPGGSGWLRLGMWCVPAIKHLIGCRSHTLRPDGLYRYCLRNGGIRFRQSDEISLDDPPGPAVSGAAARPGVHADAAAEPTG